MPIFAIFGHFLAIFGRFGPFLDREHQKQCNCNLLGATGPTNYINMVSNGYLEIWSVSDPKTNSGAKQDPKLTWGGQNWSFCTLCSPTNLFYTKNVNSEMVTSKSYFLAWNRPASDVFNWSNHQPNSWLLPVLNKSWGFFSLDFRDECDLKGESEKHVHFKRNHKGR